MLQSFQYSFTHSPFLHLWLAGHAVLRHSSTHSKPQQVQCGWQSLYHWHGDRSSEQPHCPYLQLAHLSRAHLSRHFPWMQFCQSQGQSELDLQLSLPQQQPKQVWLSLQITGASQQGSSKQQMIQLSLQASHSRAKLTRVPSAFTPQKLGSGARKQYIKGQDCWLGLGTVHLWYLASESAGHISRSGTHSPSRHLVFGGQMILEHLGTQTPNGQKDPSSQSQSELQPLLFITQFPLMQIFPQGHQTTLQEGMHCPCWQTQPDEQRIRAQRSVHCPAMQISPALQLALEVHQGSGLTQWPLQHQKPAGHHTLVQEGQEIWMQRPLKHFLPGGHWTFSHSFMHSPSTHLESAVQQTPVHLSTHLPATHFSDIGHWQSQRQPVWTGMQFPLVQVQPGLQVSSEHLFTHFPYLHTSQFWQSWLVAHPPGGMITHLPFRHTVPCTQSQFDEQNCDPGMHWPNLQVYPTGHVVTMHLSTQVPLLQKQPAWQSKLELHLGVMGTHIPSLQVESAVQMMPSHLSMQKPLWQVLGGMQLKLLEQEGTPQTPRQQLAHLRTAQRSTHLFWRQISQDSQSEQSEQQSGMGTHLLLWHWVPGAHRIVEQSIIGTQMPFAQLLPAGQEQGPIMHFPYLQILPAGHKVTEQASTHFPALQKPPNPHCWLLVQQLEGGTQRPLWHVYPGWQSITEQGSTQTQELQTSPGAQSEGLQHALGKITHLPPWQVAGRVHWLSNWQPGDVGRHTPEMQVQPTWQITLAHLSTHLFEMQVWVAWHWESDWQYPGIGEQLPFTHWQPGRHSFRQTGVTGLGMHLPPEQQVSGGQLLQGLVTQEPETQDWPDGQPVSSQVHAPDLTPTAFPFLQAWQSKVQLLQLPSLKQAQY